MKKIYFLLIGFSFFGSIHAQIVDIPDATFKAKLLEASSRNYIAKDLSEKYFKIDTNSDGQIQESEAFQVSYLEISRISITSLFGIEKFTNLKTLKCNYSNLTSLDASVLPKLQSLDCEGNKMKNINLSGLTELSKLGCGYNELTSLNLNGLTKLENLFCFSNPLTNLDVSELKYLSWLSCWNMNLTSLNINGLTNLKILDCSSNKLTSLDISECSKLTEIRCSKNNLQTLFVKNGMLTSISFSDNPRLKYICVDEVRLNDIQNLVTSYGYTNCHVNTYCSFVPGGEFFTILGNSKLDNNNNGCDIADTSFPNMKFSFSDGTNIGSLIPNETGSYSFSVQKGTHTITPVLENPSYFEASPSNKVLTFPPQTSPFTQDFCVTPNGIHPDLEVTILPIDRARPGFDASYKIIYKNKGTVTKSGSVKLTFDDTVLDLVTANPVFTSQSIDNLSWDYLDLKPFETRAIEVILNVNSPMETPAVNNDDRLSFTALINPVTGDELPLDNSFALRQLVVGSYDPNDKTCLEGSTIAPSAVGKYVHYMIRFENKGTAEAENVVIKDMIDTSKFDISSLVVTEGSHPFVTKISDTNKVEFIFEKINLPFEDATNDGYVAFKIKTKPSLVLGDSFSNTASIYFDYNFPIITNTATTSVLQSLGTQDFEFDSYFSVFPNPAKNILNIDVKKQIELSSISIFNTLGQQIVVIPNAQQTKQVDVSSLKTGNYFIKVSSNKGSASGKFIKN